MSFGLNLNISVIEMTMYCFITLICTAKMHIIMGTADAMSAIRVRKYDIERLKKFKVNNESAWETLARILNEYQHSLLSKEE